MSRSQGLSNSGVSSEKTAQATCAAFSEETPELGHLRYGMINSNIVDGWILMDKEKNTVGTNENASTAAFTSFLRRSPGLLINRNFGLLWCGQVISITGDFVFDTTLVLWITTVIARNQSWSPLAVSGLLMMTTIPTFVVGPLAGVFVDRWDKRQTMMRMDVARAILITLLLSFTGLFSLPWLTRGYFTAFWQIGATYTVVFLATCCAQFFNPSRLALIGDLVDEPERARATGLLQMTTSIAVVIAPSLAALLFFSAGIQWALIIDALSFLISFVAILMVQAPPAARSSVSGEEHHFWREFAEGIRFSMGNQVLTTILLALVLVILGSGALTTLNVFFVTQNLHAPASFYGVLSSALGAGAVIGAILAGLLAQQIGAARMFWLALLVFGVIVLIYARMTSFIPAAVLLFFLGLPNSSLNVAAIPLLLHVTPRELIGRVSAVITPIQSLTVTISAALAGYLDGVALRGFHASFLGITFGPIDTIFTGTALLALSGGFYAMAKLRGIKLAARNPTSK